MIVLGKIEICSRSSFHFASCEIRKVQFKVDSQVSPRSKYISAATALLYVVRNLCRLVQYTDSYTKSSRTNYRQLHVQPIRDRPSPLSTIYTSYLLTNTAMIWFHHRPGVI